MPPPPRLAAATRANVRNPANPWGRRWPARASPARLGPAVSGAPRFPGRMWALGGIEEDARLGLAGARRGGSGQPVFLPITHHLVSLLLLTRPPCFSSRREWLPNAPRRAIAAALRSDLLSLSPRFAFSLRRSRRGFLSFSGVSVAVANGPSVAQRCAPSGCTRHYKIHRRTVRYCKQAAYSATPRTRS